ncbi:MAG: LacI family transcriptional regulator [Puniceicoccaceae bacterium]|nr:MAG: LacI family transcriptional regulator [Puniceicoccaceae bacterium]
MRARLKDVAEKAGVATNTASTILNRRPNSWASKETEARVFKAAEDLGYRPSRAALGLRLGSFHTIGLIIPDIHNPVYATFADFLEIRMRDANYDLILENSRNDLEYEQHCLESILERQIDAVVYFVSDHDRHLEFLKKAKKAGKRVVGLTGPSDGKKFAFDAVELDFSKGVTDAVSHLLELGHKRFAFLCALAKGQSAGDRPELYNKLLKKRGVPEKNNSFISCSHDLQSAKESFGDFLDKAGDARPTALIAMNDISAIGAIRAARERNIRVPEDLSVIGVDNIPVGNFLHSSLSSIAQPLQELADATADILLTRLNDKDKASKAKTLSRKFHAKLVLKETTAKPPPRKKKA